MWGALNSVNFANIWTDRSHVGRVKAGKPKRLKKLLKGGVSFKFFQVPVESQTNQERCT
jgi:hypothetical protein